MHLNNDPISNVTNPASRVGTVDLYVRSLAEVFEALADSERSRALQTGPVYM